MSYLLDRKTKQRKITQAIVFFVFLFLLIFFRTSVLRALSTGAHFVFRPFVVLGNNVKEGFSNTGFFFQSKKALSRENDALGFQINELQYEMSNYKTILDENIKLKEILGRNNIKGNILLATILAKPNRSPYDTLLLDVGVEEGVQIGDLVFARGDVPIGKIAEAYNDSAKVILFSNPAEKTEVTISGRDAFLQVVGRGGGNFEMVIPRDFVLDIGTEVVLPGMHNNILAKVESLISDPRDSMAKALLVSPVNIQELKFVQIEVK